MDEQTRKDVDAACLRLMGWTDLEWWDKGAAPDIPGVHWAETGWYGRRAGGAGPAPSPSADSALVVPLAEALADAGWNVSIQSRSDGYWYVHLFHSERPAGRRVFEENTSPISLCIALAAARAVGTEPE